MVMKNDHFFYPCGTDGLQSSMMRFNLFNSEFCKWVQEHVGQMSQNQKLINLGPFLKVLSFLKKKK